MAWIEQMEAEWDRSNGDWYRIKDEDGYLGTVANIQGELRFDVDADFSEELKQKITELLSGDYPYAENLTMTDSVCLEYYIPEPD